MMNPPLHTSSLENWETAFARSISTRYEDGTLAQRNAIKKGEKRGKWEYKNGTINKYWKKVSLSNQNIGGKNWIYHSSYYYFFPYFRNVLAQKG